MNRSADIAAAARRLADRAGVRRTSLALLQDQAVRSATRSGPSVERTRYYFDVRDRDEYLAGHLPGSAWAPGGQLVQETDFYAPVRGAEILLADDDGTRANVTGSWLAQMGWDVSVVDDALYGPLETGPWHARPARVSTTSRVPAEVCAGLLADRTARVVEVGLLAGYRAGHLPGSAWALPPGGPGPPCRKLGRPALSCSREGRRRGLKLAGLLRSVRGSSYLALTPIAVPTKGRR